MGWLLGGNDCGGKRFDRGEWMQNKKELPPHCSDSSLSASNRNRTSDTRIFSPLLYRLSYRGEYDADGNRTHDLQRDRLAF